MSIVITTDTTNVIIAAATLATSILTGVYIYYTRKSFLEIKKQTDNQIRAYLLTSIETSAEKTASDALFDIRNNYDESIKRLLPDQSKSETNLTIKLKNRGKTDICWWSITLSIDINVGQYLKDMHLNDGVYLILKTSQTSKDVIQPEDSINVPIGNMGYIPKAVLSWNIKYKDIHGNEYTEFSGDKDYTYKNPLLFDYKNPKSALEERKSQQT